MFGFPNETVNFSQMDCEGFQDLKDFCNPINTSPPLILTIDDECRQYTDDMANLSKVTGSERIRDERNANFVVSDCPQQQTIPIAFNDVHVFSNSQDSEDNVVYEDVFFNVFTDDAPNFETELSYADSPAYQEIHSESINTTSDFVNSNIYMSVPLQMQNQKMANVMENSQFIVSNNPYKNVDYSSQNNEDSLDKYKNLEDIPLIMSQTKDEDNNRLIDNALSGFCNNLGNQQYAKDLNLSLECTILPDDTTLSKHAPTTPELYDTIEKLETEQYYKQESKVEPKSPYWTNSVKSIASELDYSCTLTPPDTPLPKTTRKKRRNSEDSDVTYVPPTKKSKSDLTAYSTSNKTKQPFKIDSEEIKPRKLGRPPKIIANVCSPYSSITDDSAASPDDIERIKRERNNEASRRSRYNRKMKEAEMADYANLLETQNDKHRKKLKKLDKKISTLKLYLRNKMVYG